MKKIILSVGLVCGLSGPLHVLAFEFGPSIVKENPMPETFFAAGYHCTSGSNAYFGFGASSVSLDEAYKIAEVDCNSHKVEPSTKFVDLKNPSYKLENINTNFDNWYCAVPGAIGFGRIRREAEYSMTANFYTKIGIINDANSWSADYFTNPAPSCNKIGLTQATMANASLAKPIIALLPSANPRVFINGSVTNLEDNGSDVEYSCFVSDSEGGKYTQVPKGDGCNVTVGSDSGDGFVVRPPIIGTADKWIKIQAKRVASDMINASGLNSNNLAPVYSLPILVAKIVTAPTPTLPLRPQLSVASSDSKTINGIISNIENPVTDYNYSCIYTSKVNADKPSPAPELVTAFLENSSICTLKYNDNNNTMSITVDLSKLTEPLKGQYFAVRVYKKSIGDIYSAFSRVIPFANIPCGAPTSDDFGKISLNEQNYQLVVPFKSIRTLATKPNVLGWNNQTADFNKPIQEISSGELGKYFIEDTIDKMDKTDFYDYRVYNICENSIKSQSYCLVRIFNPKKNPKKEPLVCATEEQIKK